MSAIDTFVANNAAHAATFEGDALPAAPAKKIAIVACMDARLDPAALLGLCNGDAHVIRNAGGIVTDDVLRSLMISQRLLGTREIMLIHHTGCGMTTIDEGELRAAIEAETSKRLPFAIGAFSNLEDSVRESMARLAASPYLVHTDAIRGFVYDVATGHLAEVS